MVGENRKRVDFTRVYKVYGGLHSISSLAALPKQTALTIEVRAFPIHYSTHLATSALGAGAGVAGLGATLD